MAGFDTVAELARRAQVSGPTVVRFATRLGFSGYPEFQRALRGDLARRIDSPLRLYGKNTEAPRGDRLLDHARDVFTRGIAATIAFIESVDAAAFDGAEDRDDGPTPSGRLLRACANAAAGAADSPSGVCTSTTCRVTFHRPRNEAGYAMSGGP